MFQYFIYASITNWKYLLNYNVSSYESVKNVIQNYE